jgi:hypothetical protein
MYGRATYFRRNVYGKGWELSGAQVIREPDERWAIIFTYVKSTERPVTIISVPGTQFVNAEPAPVFTPGPQVLPKSKREPGLNRVVTTIKNVLGKIPH